MKKHPVLDALQKASKGLLFMSETDAKLEPFLWQDAGEVAKENVLNHAGRRRGRRWKKRPWTPSSAPYRRRTGRS